MTHNIMGNKKKSQFFNKTIKNVWNCINFKCVQEISRAWKSENFTSKVIGSISTQEVKCGPIVGTFCVHSADEIFGGKISLFGQPTMTSMFLYILS